MSKAYCNGWTGCNWEVHPVDCTDWLEAAHRNQKPEEGKQEEPGTAAGTVAGSPADRSLPAQPGSLTVAGHMLLAGSNYFGCKWLAGC